MTLTGNNAALPESRSRAASSGNMELRSRFSNSVTSQSSSVPVTNAAVAPPLAIATTSNVIPVSSTVRTPTRKLVETSVGVREAAKSLGRILMRWEQPRAVLIIHKPMDRSLVPMTRDLARWLVDTSHQRAIQQVTQDSSNATPFSSTEQLHNAAMQHTITVFVDTRLKEDSSFGYTRMITPQYDVEWDGPIPVGQESSQQQQAAAMRAMRYKRRIRFWNEAFCAQHYEDIDFVITLGGDGTVLHAAWLFQRIVPPLIPFHLGSLGFLTVFEFGRYKEILTRALDEGVRINLRMRFHCAVHRARYDSATERAVLSAVQASEDQQGEESSPSQQQQQHQTAMTDMNHSFSDLLTVSRSAVSVSSVSSEQTHPAAHSATETSEDVAPSSDVPSEDERRRARVECSFEILNDLVIDRGPSPYMSQLELYGDTRHLTTVQADGLAVATPTGSTAYSLSAGGSVVHPEVPAILVTPICPHTLSFRPMLLPDSMTLRIVVPADSRNSAWASFDGRHRLELRRGDFIVISASRFPLPTVCRWDQTTDWFESLGRCLHWNERRRQQAFSSSSDGTSSLS